MGGGLLRSPCLLLLKENFAAARCRYVDLKARISAVLSLFRGKLRLAL